MNIKFFYVSPTIKEVEFVQEGVLCSSDRNGNIDSLKEGYDFSDMWNSK